jgi:hypothetical protein
MVLLERKISCINLWNRYANRHGTPQASKQFKENRFNLVHTNAYPMFNIYASQHNVHLTGAADFVFEHVEIPRYMFIISAVLHERVKLKL